jgi:hypothetical protein
VPFLVTADGTPDLTRAAIRSRSLRMPSRGLRVPTSLPRDVLTECRAIALASRDDAVFWGPTAATLLGLPLPYRLEQAPIHVLVPEGQPRPRRQGVVPRQADVAANETAMIAGLPVTSPARTYADVASVVSLPDLVAIGDAVLRDHRLTVAELHAVVTRRLRYSGKVKARAALPLLHPGSLSPQESRLRCHVHQAGLPEPEVNGLILDDAGGFLACCDLVFRRHRVVAEYDGAVHDAPARRRRDATRRTSLREHGWYVVEIVDTDLQVPSRAVDKIRRALRSSTYTR